MMNEEYCFSESNFVDEKIVLNHDGCLLFQSKPMSRLDIVVAISEESPVECIEIEAFRSLNVGKPIG